MNEPHEPCAVSNSRYAHKYMHYSKLEVWQEAMNLVVDVYTLTRRLPKVERYGLTAQMQRAAVSIPSNVAEAEGRKTWRDRAHFYVQARGSLYELATHVAICERLGYCESEAVASLLKQSQAVGRLINGALRNLNRPLDSQ